MWWATGVPGVLGALSLAYVSNLFGSMTHYGSGQVCFMNMPMWLYPSLIGAVSTVQQANAGQGVDRYPSRHVHARRVANMSTPARPVIP